MEGLTKCSLSVNPLWPAGEAGRPTECGTALGTCRQGGRFPVPGSGGGGGGCVLSPRENALMVSSSLAPALFYPPDHWCRFGEKVNL